MTGQAATDDFIDRFDAAWHAFYRSDEGVAGLLAVRERTRQWREEEQAHGSSPRAVALYLEVLDAEARLEAARDAWIETDLAE